MGREKKTAEVIRLLKQVKDEQGLSYQKILDMVTASGGYTSLSTIKRVFAEGSEEKNFRYEDSIQPIATALLHLNDDATEEQIDNPPDSVEIEALRKLVQLKNEIIGDLRSENERLKEDYQNRANYLKDQVSGKDRMIAKKERTITTLVVSIIILLMVIIIALVVDHIDPNLGFFWRGISSIVGGEDGLSGTQILNDGVMLSGILLR